MGGIVDQNSSLMGSEFPRLSDRYAPIDMFFDWLVPNNRRLLRNKPTKVQVEVLDISVAGALVVGPNIEALAPGAKIQFAFDGESGLCEIRHMREASTGDTAFYGIVFVKMTDELNARIFDRVAQMRKENSDLDDAWSRAR